MGGPTRLDEWPEDEARAQLLRCCGARRWADSMTRARPFGGEDAVYAAAERVWAGLGPGDWLEAFAQHPRIGDAAALRERFATTRAWAAGEQGDAAGASRDVLEALAEANRDYEARFGYIFIVCATGRTAQEMLALLRARLGH